ncbi:MAG: hypothetical protein JEZ06_09785 [Anaerolineaceae bacterium]|nr:hypothetical protein [Anaerolineaceae bacterium]
MKHRTIIVRIVLSIFGVLILVAGGAALFRAGMTQGMLTAGTIGSEVLSPHNFNPNFGMGFYPHRGMMFLPVLFGIFLIIAGIRWLMRGIFQPTRCFDGPMHHRPHPGHFRRMHTHGYAHGKCCEHYPYHKEDSEDCGCTEENEECCQEEDKASNHSESDS